METKWLAAAAIAPVAWGSGYYVTATYLPADRPLFGAAVRALPFGLLLLALRPSRLRGSWWWRTALLGKWASIKKQKAGASAPAPCCE